MASSSAQKLKVLHLMDILRTETDPDHGLTMPQLIERLAARGIDAERKGIYRDIETLREFGMDIRQLKRQPVQYALAERDFELSQLTLLVDAVQSSRFLSDGASRALVKSVRQLASAEERKALNKQVHVHGRPKRQDWSDFVSVDLLQEAMARKSKVSFRYYKYGAGKERVARKGGAAHVVTPVNLTYSDGNYYLVAYDHKEEEIRHYRVDRMMKAEVLDEPMQGAKERKALRRDDYAKRTFGMFAGETREVRLEFDERMVDVILDRFGLDTRMHYVKADKKEELDRGSVDSGVQEAPRRVQAVVEVEVSQQFFGWITGLGPHMSIVGPLDVRTSYMEQLERTLGNYR